MFWKLLEKLNNNKKKKNWSPLQKKNMVLVVKNYIKIGIKFLVLSSFAWVTHIVPLILSTIESNRNLCDIFHVVFVFFYQTIMFRKDGSGNTANLLFCVTSASTPYFNYIKIRVENFPLGMEIYAKLMMCKFLSYLQYRER